MENGHRNLKDRKVIFRQKLVANYLFYLVLMHVETSDDSFWGLPSTNWDFLGNCWGDGNGWIETAVQPPSTSWRERLGTYFWVNLSNQKAKIQPENCRFWMPPQLENAAACSFLCSFLSQLGSCLMTLPINLLKCYYSCTLNSIDGFFPACFLSFYSWSRVLKFSWNIHTAPFSVVKAPPWLPKTMWRKQRVLDLQSSQIFGQPHFSRPIMEMDQKAPWLRFFSLQHASTLAFGGWLRDAWRLWWLNKLVFATCHLRMWPQLTVLLVFWWLDIGVVVGQFPASVVFHWVCRPRIILCLI